MTDSPFSWKNLLLAACAVVVVSGDAAGAGYAIMEQSVRGLGTAFAGGAASADDASTVFYNPAGLSRLPGSRAIAGMHVVLPSARFRNHGSYDLGGEQLTGSDGGEAGRLIAVPNLYYSSQLGDRIHVGFGIFSPFGVSSEYDATWAGRYHAVKSDLITLNINPAIACRITDKLSIGAGVNAQYIKSELSNAIDFGAIFGALGSGTAPQNSDGSVTFKGDSWSWGYNVGVLYQFAGHTRAGVAYRSRIDHTLTGDAHFSGVPFPNPTGRFSDTGIRADVTLPDSLSVSLWHGFSRDVAVMADITWTNWSTFDELRIRFENPAETDAVTTYNWKDTMRYSLGAVYAPGAWAFRSGVAYDESPVPDAAHRTPTLPDNDRIWVTAGVGYRITDVLSVDAGYAHLFVEDGEIRKSAAGEDRFRGGLSGSYKNSVDVISAELAWLF